MEGVAWRSLSWQRSTQRCAGAARHGILFSRAGLRPDMVILGDGAQLIVDVGTLAIDLSQAVVISARKVIARRPLPCRERLANLRQAQERGLSWASGAGLGPFWSGLDAVMSGDLPKLLAGSPSSLCGAAAGPLCELVAGLRSGDIARSAHAEERLVGLGYGLTPSCDDMLTGIMGAMSILGDALGLAERLAPLLDAAALQPRDTRISSPGRIFSARYGARSRARW